MARPATIDWSGARVSPGVLGMKQNAIMQFGQTLQNVANDVVEKQKQKKQQQAVNEFIGKHFGYKPEVVNAISEAARGNLQVAMEMAGMNYQQAMHRLGAGQDASVYNQFTPEGQQSIYGRTEAMQRERRTAYEMQQAELMKAQGEARAAQGNGPVLQSPADAIDAAQADGKNPSSVTVQRTKDGSFTFSATYADSDDEQETMPMTIESNGNQIELTLEKRGSHYYDVKSGVRQDQIWRRDDWSGEFYLNPSVAQAHIGGGEVDIPTISNQSEYDALPSGSQYYDSTGKLATKK